MPKTTTKKSILTSSKAAKSSPVGASDYEHFLNTYIVPAQADRKSDKKFFSQNMVNGWQKPDLTTSLGKIVNEQAKKFNHYNSMGIRSVPRFNLAGAHNSYRANIKGEGTIELAPPPYKNKEYGPLPSILGHELVHANDHQVDNINSRIWERIRNLAMTGNPAAFGTPMDNFDQLGVALGNIQEKIDLTNAFKPDPAVPNSGYPVTADYIENGMTQARNTYQHPDAMAVFNAQKAAHQANTPMPANYRYNIPVDPANGNPDWPTLFNDIQGMVGGSNPGFSLNVGSEFPAFMMENLPRSWNTAGGIPLTIPEAQTIYHMVNDLTAVNPALFPAYGAAAAQDAYPETNALSKQRRNSILNAYQPAYGAALVAAEGANVAPPAAPAGWSHGGRVTQKNLLSRFIKPKRKAS